jgi:hypothetical protein
MWRGDPPRCAASVQDARPLQHARDPLDQEYTAAEEARQSPPDGALSTGYRNWRSHTSSFDFDQDEAPTIEVPSRLERSRSMKLHGVADCDSWHQNNWRNSQ